MSSTYQPKNKQLANVRVVSADTYGKNRSAFTYVGSIWRGLSNFITTKRNKKTGRCSYIDDTSSLTKKTKGDVARFFSDNGNATKKVAYLVVPRPLPQTSAASTSSGSAKKKPKKP